MSEWQEAFIEAAAYALKAEARAAEAFLLGGVPASCLPGSWDWRRGRPHARGADALASVRSQHPDRSLPRLRSSTKTVRGRVRTRFSYDRRDSQQRFRSRCRDRAVLVPAQRAEAGHREMLKSMQQGS